MNRAESLIFPGDSTWELWKFPAKALPACEQAPPPKSLAAAPAPLLALPSRTVMAVPLWISAEGDPNELAELELSGRHLVRRDAEVRTIPVESSNGRSLILALAVADDPSSLHLVSHAKFFDLPARLIDPGSADVAIGICQVEPGKGSVNGIADKGIGTSLEGLSRLFLFATALSEGGASLVDFFGGGRLVEIEFDTRAAAAVNTRPMVERAEKGHHNKH